MSYFAAIAAHDRAVIDGTMPFDKRLKAAHRYDITDTRGPLSLTVPISKPLRPATSSCANDGSDVSGIKSMNAKARWDEILISTHGSWWDVHRVTLESAYGRTPYFEYLFDDFKPFYAPAQYETGSYPLIALIAATTASICQMLGITTRLSVTPSPADPAILQSTPNTILDLRRHDFTTDPCRPYYQHRGAAFTPALSILDPIFNIGPTAIPALFI